MPYILIMFLWRGISSITYCHTKSNAETLYFLATFISLCTRQYFRIYVGLNLGRRCTRWVNNNPTWSQRLVFAWLVEISVALFLTESAKCPWGGGVNLEIRLGTASRHLNHHHWTGGGGVNLEIRLGTASRHLNHHHWTVIETSSLANHPCSFP